MTRGLKWGVLAGVTAGVLVIILLDLRHVHGQFGGLLAAGVTGAVIFLVRRTLDGRAGPGDGPGAGSAKG